MPRWRPIHLRRPAPTRRTRGRSHQSYVDFRNVRRCHILGLRCREQLLERRLPLFSSAAQRIHVRTRRRADHSARIRRARVSASYGRQATSNGGDGTHGCANRERCRVLDSPRHDECQRRREHRTASALECDVIRRPSDAGRLASSREVKGTSLMIMAGCGRSAIATSTDSTAAVRPNAVPRLASLPIALAARPAESRVTFVYAPLR